MKIKISFVLFYSNFDVKNMPKGAIFQICKKIHIIIVEFLYRFSFFHVIIWYVFRFFAFNYVSLTSSYV